MKNFSFITILCWLSLSTGCAFSNVNMKLPTDLSVSRVATTGGQPITVVVPFEDVRTTKDRCGMQKNGYNMDTADATCDVPQPEWIANLLVAELQSAGFDATVTSEAPSPSNVPTVEGSLVKLFVEPVIGMWSGSIEADLQTRLKVQRADGLDAERTFFVKGVRKGVQFSLTPIYEGAISEAATRIVREMAQAVSELLKEYPVVQ